MMAVFGNPFQPGSILWDHRGFFNTTMGFMVGIAVPRDDRVPSTIDHTDQP